MMHLHFIVILFKKWNPRDDDIDELHNYSYKKKSHCYLLCVCNSDFCKSNFDRNVNYENGCAIAQLSGFPLTPKWEERGYCDWVCLCVSLYLSLFITQKLYIVSWSYFHIRWCLPVAWS